MKNLLQKLPFLASLEAGEIYPFVSEAEFSMHHVLEELLKITGKAEVKVSSFSISETALRSFYRLTEQGAVTGLQCLLDISVKRHKLGLLFFANNTGIEVSLVKNHAKLVLISNNEWKIAIIGSANLQENDKNETGMICTKTDIYEYYDAYFGAWFGKGLKIGADEFN
ncbi:MAG TPA: hypothetical protein VLH16_06450 [Bacteroidales bacterium]|nr:hypothetical protein [Bacteroidales bacterium]